MVSGFPLFALILVAVLLIVLATSRWKMHPFLVLLLASLGVGITVGMPLQNVVKTMTEGFGGLMAYIGIVVILGGIIGSILEKSGAANRLAEAILSLTGPRRPTLGITLIGAIVGIPVFCDSGFVILSRLNQNLAQRAKLSPAVLTMGLSGGLYTTHTLVPPTPGPIAAAGTLGLSDQLGYVILLGILVAIPVGAVVLLLAKRLGGKIDVPLEEVPAPEKTAMPSLFRALLPIGLPLLLISIGTILTLSGIAGTLGEGLIFLGNPLIALLLGTLASFSLLPEWAAGQKWIGEGIVAAGPILILTGAGGAFGAVLKATPIRDSLAMVLPEDTLGLTGLLIMGWLLAAFLKSAQGSSTSALVIASAMLAPLAIGAEIIDPYPLALLTLAIGGGAMTVSHANDSFFWVVSQFGRLSLSEAYRSYTLMTLAQGLTVLGAVLLLSIWA